MSSLLVFANHFLPGSYGGGPIKSVANLLSIFKDAENEITLITSNKDHRSKTVYSKQEMSDVKVQFLHVRITYTTGILDHLLSSFSSIKRLDLGSSVYLNSFWNFKFSIVPILIVMLMRRDVRLIIAPRGELAPEAIAIKRLKKEFYIKLFSLFSRYFKVCWHATWPGEKGDIRRVFGVNEEVVVLQNIAIYQPGIKKRSPPDGFVKFIYFGRLSQHKRTKELIALFSSPKLIGAGAQLDIWGVEDNVCVQEILAHKGFPPNVNYFGGYKEVDLESMCSSANYFVTYTLGENFGHSISEALSLGLPVFLTGDTYFSSHVSGQGLGFLLSGNMQKDLALIEESLGISDQDYMRIIDRIDAFNLGRMNTSKRAHAYSELFFGKGVLNG